MCDLIIVTICQAFGLDKEANSLEKMAAYLVTTTAALVYPTHLLSARVLL